MQLRACAEFGASPSSLVKSKGWFMSDEISFDDFLKVDVRVGKVVEAEEFPEARKPAYKMRIDFGPDIGIKKTSAQITKHYTPESLVGKLVMAVVNFPPRQIGPVRSEVLTLGVPDDEGEVVLLTPDKDVPIGGRLY
ncbi:tRNA-binding protein YgjH [Roseibium album]|uniref:tRNA-binding protein YgjH n=2 Tax=Roseibium album TaxID=311410 RepID=A0A0M6ZB93_9HYPH|nr:tRNA-binding protein YgjH [Roseibium album]CTQ77217.1 tRNA-binding protein YgjH [Roseibium album]CTQ77511.1 tRNA-binding protein YgjH [Roseibium album]